jgi:hypothetical protein
MIAPIREYEPEAEQKSALSESARQAAASLLGDPCADRAPAIPAWQAWLLVTWMVVTSIAYVAITLGIWPG